MDGWLEFTLYDLPLLLTSFKYIWYINSLLSFHVRSPVYLTKWKTTDSRKFTLNFPRKKPQICKQKLKFEQQKHVIDARSHPSDFKGHDRSLWNAEQIDAQWCTAACTYKCIHPHCLFVYTWHPHTIMICFSLFALIGCRNRKILAWYFIDWLGCKLPCALNWCGLARFNWTLLINARWEDKVNYTQVSVHSIIS